MAREDISQLGEQLRNTRFGFVPRGEHDLTDIYRAVQNQFPHLCDDDYRCDENCKSDHDQPEWNHATRRALNALKGKGVGVDPTEARGRWLFY